MTKIGLLPLYVAMYDRTSPKARPIVERFKDEVIELLSAQDLQVVASDVCCVKEQFENAVTLFEKEQVDAIVTLHLAYSPSLESYEILSNTKLPILVLDATPAYSFAYDSDVTQLMYNHGIHGVQEMCCMLKRSGKPYSVFAGHYLNSDVISKVANAAKAISSANVLKKGIKIGMIGDHFEGMGDFVVEKEILNNLGITEVNCSGEELEKSIESITVEQIKEEYQKDKSICKMDDVTFEQYQPTEKIALGIRKWLKDQGLKGFSMNFQSVGQLKGFSIIPFSEASKAMANGYGYAGEGDMLTAGLCAAFLENFKQTGFTEMFCPDWQNQTIYLSHMGEFNMDLMQAKHMLAKPNGSTCILGTAKSGKVCYVNILPNGKGSFDMIFVDGEMVCVPEDVQSFKKRINGWFKPNMPIEKFLEEFSAYGGTHHSIIVYGAKAQSLVEFAKQLNLDYKVL